MSFNFCDLMVFAIFCLVAWLLFQAAAPRC
jgi:hypothetical protein